MAGKDKIFMQAAGSRDEDRPDEICRKKMAGKMDVCMKSFFYLISLLLLCLGCSNPSGSDSTSTSAGVKTWTIPIPSDNSDYNISAIRCSQALDGGYWVLCFTYSSSGDNYLQLNKLDAAGKVLSSSPFDDTTGTYGVTWYGVNYTLSSVSDGGCVIQGSRWGTFFHSSYSGFINGSVSVSASTYKFDKNGCIQWQVLDSQRSSFQTNSVIDGNGSFAYLHSPSGFIFDTTSSASFLLQGYNYNGTQLPSIQLPAIAQGMAATLSTSLFWDGMKYYIVGGSGYSFQGGSLINPGGIITELSPGGGLLSNKTISLPTNLAVSRIIMTSDGCFIYAGYTVDFTSDTTVTVDSISLAKYDKNGIQVWDKTYSKAVPDWWGAGLYETKLHYYLFTNGDEIFETDTNGNQIWGKTLVDTGAVYDCIECPDGGILVACSKANGNYSGAIVEKLDSSGNL